MDQKSPQPENTTENDLSVDQDRPQISDENLTQLNNPDQEGSDIGPTTNKNPRLREKKPPF